MDSILMTRAEMHAAFRQWVIDDRSGKTRPEAEVAALSADEYAEGNVRAFLDYVEQARAAAR